MSPAPDPYSDTVVYLVDDDPAVRHSLTRLLDSAGYRSAAFESAEEFLAHRNRLQRGCVLLDVRMPGMSGLELQNRLNADGNPLPIIIITGHADVPMAIAALKAGAFDFIEKPFDDEALLERIRQAVEAEVAQRRDEETRQQSRDKIETLSPREREILDGLTEGKTVEQIAAHLGISPKTVYMHRSHLMTKTGTDSIASLVRLKLAAE
jgi:two-component system response regulator FixJ